MKTKSKEKTGYIYWDLDNGEIYAVSPHLLDNPKTENPPLEVPMREVALFTTGGYFQNHYYVSFSKSKDYEIKKKDLDFSLSISDIAKGDSLIEVLEGAGDSELLVCVGDKEITLELNLEGEELPSAHFHLYLTEPGDPYHHLQEIAVNTRAIKFAQNKGKPYTVKVKPYGDYSIWTTPLFRSCERCKA